MKKIFELYTGARSWQSRAQFGAKFKKSVFFSADTDQEKYAEGQLATGRGDLLIVYRFV